jgi:serine/threonine protein kinase
MLERLESEARAMASLEHPSLCGIVEVCLDASRPFLVMEWAGGEPLDRYARRQSVRRRA